MDSMAAENSREIFVKLRVHSCTPKYGRSLGVALGEAQSKKFFQTWQNDFLNLFPTWIGEGVSL